MLKKCKSACRKALKPKWPDDKPPWDDSMSDGCTLVADSPDTIHCCLAHDKAYYQATGGRAKADREFLGCMKAAGWGTRAYVRWAGVRIFGWLWYTDDEEMETATDLG